MYERSFKMETESYKGGKTRTVNNDEHIVPALNMKKPIDFNTVDDEDFQGTG